MIINNSSDVEYRSRFKPTNKLHKRKGLFGKRLAAVAIQIEMIGDIQRIFYCLFEIIGRTPFLHIIYRKSIRSLFDIGDILLFPLLYATIIAHGVIGYKLEHSVG